MKVKQKCKNCALLRKNKKDFYRHYYLGRPHGCCLDEDGIHLASHLPDEPKQNINKNNDCVAFIKKELRKPFQECESIRTGGPIDTWVIFQDDIEPWDPKYDYHTWFRYGFHMALKLYGFENNKQLIRTCNNCSITSPHNIDKDQGGPNCRFDQNKTYCSEKNTCDTWRFDDMMFMNFRYRGNLCDDCQLSNSCQKKTILGIDRLPTTNCEDWIEPKEEENCNQ
jgi:hypothetical protein